MRMRSTLVPNTSCLAYIIYVQLRSCLAQATGLIFSGYGLAWSSSHPAYPALTTPCDVPVVLFSPLLSDLWKNIRCLFRRFPAFVLTVRLIFVIVRPMYSATTVFSISSNPLMLYGKAIALSGNHTKYINTLRKDACFIDVTPGRTKRYNWALKG